MGAAVSCISVHGGGHSTQIPPATQLQPRLPAGKWCRAECGQLCPSRVPAVPHWPALPLGHDFTAGCSGAPAVVFSRRQHHLQIALLWLCLALAPSAAGSQKGFESLGSNIAQKANLVQAALISSIKRASELTTPDRKTLLQLLAGRRRQPLISTLPTRLLVNPLFFSINS